MEADQNGYGDGTRSGEGLTMSCPPASLTNQSYRERVPAPQLTEILSCVWLLHVAKGGPAYKHRTVPNGCFEIACVLETGTVRLVGPRRRPSLEEVGPGKTVLASVSAPGSHPWSSGPLPKS